MHHDHPDYLKLHETFQNKWKNKDPGFGPGHGALTWAMLHRLLLVKSLLKVTTTTLRDAGEGESHTFFSYMKITPYQFYRHIRKFKTEEILQAIGCIIADQWEQSEFIGSAENQIDYKHSNQMKYYSRKKHINLVDNRF